MGIPWGLPSAQWPPPGRPGAGLVSFRRVCEGPCRPRPSRTSAWEGLGRRHPVRWGPRTVGCGEGRTSSWERVLEAGDGPGPEFLPIILCSVSLQPPPGGAGLWVCPPPSAWPCRRSPPRLPSVPLCVPVGPPFLGSLLAASRPECLVHMAPGQGPGLRGWGAGCRPGVGLGHKTEPGVGAQGAGLVADGKVCGRVRTLRSAVSTGPAGDLVSRPGPPARKRGSGAEHSLLPRLPQPCSAPGPRVLGLPGHAMPGQPLVR